MPIDKSASAIPFYDKSADRQRRTFKYTGPTSYATGGDSLNLLSDLGLGQVHVVQAEPASNGTLVKAVVYNRSTGKFQWFDAAGTETANGTNLSGYTTYIEVVGR